MSKETGLGERMAQDRGRWCFASWDHPWEGWFYVRLTVYLPSLTIGLRASTGFPLPVHEPEDVWARDVAANLGLDLARKSFLAQIGSYTQEQENQVDHTAFQVLEEIHNVLNFQDPFSEDGKMEIASSAMRWEIDYFDFPAEALALRFVELGMVVAGEIIGQENPALGAEIEAVATWLQGGELLWPEGEKARLTCPECGKEFDPWRKDQKFCTAKCGQKVRTRKAKQKAREKAKETT